MKDLILELHRIFREIQEELAQALSQDQKILIKQKYLNKKGILSKISKDLPLMTIAERKEAGQLLNKCKNSFVDINLVKTVQGDMGLLDLTLPGNSLQIGRLHPITVVTNQLKEYFSKLGFQDFEDNNEIDTPFYNFEALNLPEGHPARKNHDTFYIDPTHLLRTHTSGAQIRALEQLKAPLRIMSTGPVYRKDSIDRTHTPMFHQFEGFWVDRDISFSNLLAMLEAFIKHFLDQSIEIRCRPSYFPFTDPSAEIDIRLSKQQEWMEAIGCGITHREVLRPYVNNDYQACAFGVGIERLVMLKYQIDDIRMLFNSDINFLKHIFS